MVRFLPFFSKPPSLKGLPLERYRVAISLDKLVFGVDSIHIDVRISPRVRSAIRRAAAVAMVRHCRCEDYFPGHRRKDRENEKLTLKDLCTELLVEGVYRAKAEARCKSISWDSSPS